MDRQVSDSLSVTRAAGVVSGATLCSRILGFVRDMIIAWFFGAGMCSDAFFTAFRIPNLMRRLFAEGSLTMAFIPVFTEIRLRQGKEQALHLAWSAMRVVFGILLVLAAVGVMSAPVIVRIFAPGFEPLSDRYALTVVLTRMMFPYIVFVGLTALAMGILNGLGYFAAPAFAPLMLNLAIIGSALFISPRLAHPVMGLAVGVLIGGTFQVLLQVPILSRCGVLFRNGAGLFHRGLKKIAVRMIPTVFGAAVYQINMVIGTLLASFLAEGSISWLYYADRLVQFPLGLFGVAAATAVMPTLSRQAAQADHEALAQTVTEALSLVLFITIPAMAGLMVLKDPIVMVLFKRGAFDAESVRQTSAVLFYYAVGLWSFSLVRIVVSTFYALQDTRTPVKIATVSVAANIVLGVILMKPMAHCGLALATSMASVIQLVLLFRILNRKLGGINMKHAALSACKSVAGSVIMGFFVWLIAFRMIPGHNGATWGLLRALLLCIPVGMVIYGMCARVMKSPEIGLIARTVHHFIHSS